mmetsp:Transcript_39473/g.77075  ORF Transcript_39473/g.77075 Transcript_39473/m.77075 type:complete len:167 (+) Transcript_39473:534-1034(+)
MMQWLRERGCPWDWRTCCGAARNGHLEILQWAREQECPWNEWTCAGATAGGHFDILKWARANECPWNSKACWSAAANNKLGVLRWALEHGCPYKERDIRERVVDPEFLEWFGSNKTTFEKEESSDYWSDASSDGDETGNDDNDAMTTMKTGAAMTTAINWIEMKNK